MIGRVLAHCGCRPLYLAPILLEARIIHDLKECARNHIQTLPLRIPVIAP